MGRARPGALLAISENQSEAVMTMNVRLDLHVHSAASHDGRMTPAEIAAAARKAGLQGVAVCDHDVLFEQGGLFEGLLVIPGVELSTEWGHLLGLFVTEPIPPGTAEQRAAAIRAQGGLAVLAHPFQHRREDGALDAIAPFLDGVEVWNSRADRKFPDANIRAKAFADKHRLLYFAGSDAHVPEEIGAGFVQLEVPRLTLAAVRSALLERAGTVQGVSSPARHVARSQRTKLKKRKAGLPAWGKWLLFAAKCCLQDRFRGKGERHVFDR